MDQPTASRAGSRDDFASLDAVQDAKRHLVSELRRLDGFVGVSIGPRGIIRLYVQSTSCAAARHFHSRFGRQYRGHPVAVEQSRGFRALASR